MSPTRTIPARWTLAGIVVAVLAWTLLGVLVSDVLHRPFLDPPVQLPTVHPVTPAPSRPADPPTILEQLW